MKIFNVISRMCAAVLLATIAPVNAQTFTPLQGNPVIDVAQVIPDDAEDALNAKLNNVYKTTNRQLVVATVSTLEGYDIDDYKNKYFRFLALGQKGIDNGVLVLIAPTEKRAGIEVGYGLEPYLTDATSGQILDEQMVPHFKMKDWVAGVNAGVDAIIPVITPEAIEKANEEKQVALAAAQETSNKIEAFFSWILMIIAGVGSIFGIVWLARIPARRRAKAAAEAAAKAEAERIAALQEEVRKQREKQAENERIRQAEFKKKQDEFAEQQARQRKEMLDAMTDDERVMFLAAEKAEAVQKENDERKRVEAERQKAAERAAAQKLADDAARQRRQREEDERRRDSYTSSYSSSSSSWDSSSSYSSSSDTSGSSFSGDGGSSGGGGASSGWD